MEVQIRILLMDGFHRSEKKAAHFTVFLLHNGPNDTTRNRIRIERLLQCSLVMGGACCACASNDVANGKNKAVLFKAQNAGNLDVDILYGNKNRNPVAPPLEQMLLIQYLRNCRAPGPMEKVKDLDEDKEDKNSKKRKKNKSKSKEKKKDEKVDRRCETVADEVTKMVRITWEKRDLRRKVKANSLVELLLMNAWRSVCGFCGQAGLHQLVPNWCCCVVVVVLIYTEITEVQLISLMTTKTGKKATAVVAAKMCPGPASSKARQQRSAFYLGIVAFGFLFLSVAFTFGASNAWGPVETPAATAAHTGENTSLRTPQAVTPAPISLPVGCQIDDCIAGGGEPFGTYLGEHAGVAGYSNCFSKTCISYTPHFLTRDSERTNTSMPSGMKWQCVEYARRYWMIRGAPEPAIFPDVDGAADIWNLTYSVLLDRQIQVPLLKIPNAEAHTLQQRNPKMEGDGSTPASFETGPPQVGDLLIYPRDAAEFPYGHVAVVVGVNLDSPRIIEASGFDAMLEGSIYVAEQNWDNKLWAAKNYSREIPVHWVSKGGRDSDYRVVEEDGCTVLGWVRPDTSLMNQQWRYMSRDSHYAHDLWHIEGPALTIACPKLELLADFDVPGSYTYPVSNAGLHSNTRVVMDSTGGALREFLAQEPAGWPNMGIPSTYYVDAAVIDALFDEYMGVNQLFFSFRSFNLIFLWVFVGVVVRRKNSVYLVVEQMTTQTPNVSGSSILLEKIAPYNQCRAYIQSAQAPASHEAEGNQLMGGPQTYPLLALARGVLQVLEAKHTEAADTPPEVVIGRLAHAMEAPFTSIHKNMAALSSRRVWWLDSQSVAAEELLRARLKEERDLLDAAIALPSNKEVVFPSVGTMRREGKRHERRKNEDDSEMMEWDRLSSKRRRVETGASLCHYGTALLQQFGSSLNNAEINSIYSAIRADSFSVSRGAKATTRSSQLASLIDEIKQNAVTTSHSKGEQTAVQAYLKRCLWIMDQSRFGVYGQRSWQELSEGERTRHIISSSLQKDDEKTITFTNILRNILHLFFRKKTQLTACFPGELKENMHDDNLLLSWCAAA
eukprot:gene10622-7382_t